ncbi:MAG TPA: HAD family acid phosphatase [Gemmatimonadales bacterium]
MRRLRGVALFLGVVATAGCAAHPRATAAPTPALSPGSRNDIHWFRSSAEYRGIVIEIYRTAAARLTGLTRGRQAGTWAVILDADETVLDNSLHERRLADRNQGFTEAAWTRWVRERAANAIPGAVDFTRQVHQLGGRVAIVTNRADSLCAPTRENLRSVGIEADIVLCQPGTESDKNPRFQRIQQGTAMAGIPALDVVEWLGDNIQDFPDLDQSIRDSPVRYADFGLRFFLLPNPMYGSWTGNAEP